jgi:hypothetical protein
MELKQALLKIDVATRGEIYDFSCGGWMVNAIETNLTLTDFEVESKNYAEHGKIQRGKLAGFDFVYFGLVQVVKGHPRFLLSVIDLGGVRFSLNENLICYAD